jgi:hypothetical protein
MTGSTLTPRDIESCADRLSPSEKYHPLLHLLRIMLVEAYRYQKQFGDNSFHVLSIKSLFQQLDFLWAQLQGEPMEKYDFIRSRLSLLLLWNNEKGNFARSIMNPPLHMSNVFRCKRRMVLDSLLPGKLFVGSS